MKYLFISEHKKAWPIDLMCRVLGVGRNGYYSYQKRKRTKGRDREREELLEWVTRLASSSDNTYGVRRIKKALNALGYPVGKSKTRGLMREAGVFVRYRKKYKSTTNSNHSRPLFENVLNRQFNVAKPNVIYVSDITYIRTKEGWLYLAVVIDLYSRKVVGWSMDSRMKAQLVCDALQMALWQRKPPKGIIVHSDRGSQYASNQYRTLLETHECIGSMSRKGNCWDNSVAESFFGRLKQERVEWRSYETRQEAKQDLLAYITMFYNNSRLHSYLGYKSPNVFEEGGDLLKSAA
jgi:putative transposase